MYARTVRNIIKLSAVQK